MARSLCLLLLAAALSVAGCASEQRPGSALERLPNGLTVIVKENRGDDIVSVQAWVRDGSLFETAASSGAGYVLVRSLLSQFESRGGGKAARAIEAAGGRIAAIPGQDNAHIVVTVPSGHFDDALDALAGVVVHPEFSAGDVERAKADALASLDALAERPIDKALLLCLGAIARGHPLSRPVPGSPTVVASLDAAALAARHRERYVGENMAVVVVGNIAAREAADKVARAFADLPQGRPAVHAAAAVTWPEKAVYVSEKGDFKRAYVVMALPGPGVKDADHVAVDVLMMALASGRASLLSRALVDERGLAGSLGGGWYTREQPSPCLVWMELAPENVAAAEEAAVEVIASLATKPPAPEDLARGKSLLRSAIAFQRDTCEQQAAYEGYWYTIAGEGYADSYDSRIDGVTVEDLRKAAAEYLRPQARATAVLEPTWVR